LDGHGTDFGCSLFVLPAKLLNWKIVATFALSYFTLRGESVVNVWTISSFDLIAAVRIDSFPFIPALRRPGVL
jgi:hypothetical protein